MKIFISHSYGDYKLAKILKDSLKENEDIKEIFIFEDEKEFGNAIDKKIIREIKQSDYLIAIITKNSLRSASVNQEIGFAQGIGIERIPIVEKNAKQGFLIYGYDKLFFSNKKIFEKRCYEVKDYVLKKGPRNKASKEEIDLIQKSAHYRNRVHIAMNHVLDSIFLRLNMGDMAKRYELFSTKNASWKTKNINYIQKFLKKDTTELIDHFSQIKLEYFRKLNDLGYDDFVHELNDAKRRFPHIEKSQEEADILIKLEEFIRNLPEGNFDLTEFIKLHYNSTLKESETFSEILKKEDSKHSPLRRHIEFIISDLLELTEILYSLQNLYIGYKRKFGNIAFKN